MVIPFIPKNAIISQISFSVGKLEYWKFPFAKVISKKECYPPYRKHLIGGWFWRNCNEET